VAFIAAAMDAICSATAPVGTQLHRSTDSLPASSRREGSQGTARGTGGE